MATIDKGLFSEIAVILLLFAIVIGFSYYQEELYNNKNNEIRETCFDNNCFQVEISDSDEERMLGLMSREELDENKGMLFAFEQEGEYSFWMKDTLIPLDIVWINENKEIVFIMENAVPCLMEECDVINPQASALYVLEINSGISQKIGLEIGEKVRFK